eukprot:CAMPEP_0176057522 /NCGR_PEP_ID=MMETSP0120_2-20121206/28650_1 /TAXON_ID=160619 /ORGANISM="Kryptoperidinium foliaceum, Strain CCMP 1326" /LENGTH=316 /DNA_ID=CAMNT_0017391033 /DNA_START=63 /DNA_END=1013 /DNA_ORIENTATION=-
MAQWRYRPSAAVVVCAAGCWRLAGGVSVSSVHALARQPVQELLQGAADISTSLGRLSGHSSLDPVTRHFLASLRVCGACDSFRRLGEAHDGGYLTCMDGWAQGGVKAAFSMGVEHHDKWSQDMSALLKGGSGRTVLHQFDCTVSSGQACPGCEFHKICIAAENATEKQDFWSLSQVLKHTGLENTPDRSLIMKMDIEAAEWPILSSERTDVLQKFRQVILEFHWLNQEAKHKQYDAAVQTLLQAGFSVVHIHGNNCGGGMYSVPGSSVSVPNVLEVTFVADARRIECQNRQTISPLDADNAANIDSLPMATLPGNM